MPVESSSFKVKAGGKINGKTMVLQATTCTLSSSGMTVECKLTNLPQLVMLILVCFAAVGIYAGVVLLASWAIFGSLMTIFTVVFVVIGGGIAVWSVGKTAEKFIPSISSDEAITFTHDQFADIKQSNQSVVLKGITSGLFLRITSNNPEVAKKIYAAMNPANRRTM